MATFKSASAYWNDRKARDAKRKALLAEAGLPVLSYNGKRAAFKCSNQPICKICCVCGDH